MNELIDWLDWMIDWMIDWLDLWLVRWAIDWLNEWLVRWPIDWINELLIKWVIDLMSDWLNEWLIWILISDLFDELLMSYWWVIDWPLMARQFQRDSSNATLVYWLIDDLFRWLIYSINLLIYRSINDGKGRRLPFRRRMDEGTSWLWVIPRRSFPRLSPCIPSKRDSPEASSPQPWVKSHENNN